MNKYIGRTKPIAAFPAIIALTSVSVLLTGCGGGGSSAQFAASLPAHDPPAPTSPPPPPPPAPPAASAPAPSFSASSIQNNSGWKWCTKSTNGGVCASGRGKAVSWMAQHQSQPSLSGSSAEFFIGGSTAYSNALWWNSLGPNSQPGKFSYDLWFYIDHADVAQALEFDVNQSFGGTRWIFGTECNFKDTHKWDVWDSGKNKWVPSSAPCHPFASKSWNHLVWSFERSGSQVHYISVTVNGTTMPVNLYLAAEKNKDLNGSDLNVAFQLDGDSHQQPYSVWLDRVSLNGW
jgi:hypothetical protein